MGLEQEIHPDYQQVRQADTKEADIIALVKRQ
jgi:hypothetical protein